MKRRDFLKKGAAALGLVAAQPACSTLSYVFSKRDVIETSDLVINDSFTHNVTYKSRESGEADLKGLAKIADKEEAWLFVEGNDNSFWIDIGIEQEKGQVNADIKFTRNILSNLGDYGINPDDCVNLTFYHIHPEKSAKKNLQEGINDFLNSSSEIIHAVGGTPDFPPVVVVDQDKWETCLLPSVNDIVAVPKLKYLFSRPNVNVGESVVIAPTCRFDYDTAVDADLGIFFSDRKENLQLAQKVSLDSLFAGFGLDRLVLDGQLKTAMDAKDRKEIIRLYSDAVNTICLGHGDLEASMDVYRKNDIPLGYRRTEDLPVMVYDIDKRQ